MFNQFYSKFRGINDGLVPKPTAITGAYLKDNGTWDTPGVSSFVPLARTVSGSNSVTGGGALSADVTLSLVNDLGSPGANKVYGTTALGVKGWVDAAPGATVTITGTQSVTGGGDLSANRTLSLVNDSATPGNGKYYGTNASGVKGWYDSTAGATITITGTKSVTGGGDLTANRTLELVNDNALPGNNKVYGTDGTGVKGWYDNGVSSTTTVTGTKSITGGGDLSTNRTFELVNDSTSPGNDSYYGTNSSGVKGWYSLTPPDLSSYALKATTVSTTDSITGGGDLSANRTLSLVNDTATPGNSKYYGTDGAGTRGWHNVPNVAGYVATTRLVATQHSLTGGGDLSSDRTINLVNDVTTPTNGQFYGYSGGARGWFTPAATAVSDGKVLWKAPSGVTQNYTTVNAAVAAALADNTDGGHLITINAGNYNEARLDFSAVGWATWSGNKYLTLHFNQGARFVPNSSSSAPTINLGSGRAINITGYGRIDGSGTTLFNTIALAFGAQVGDGNVSGAIIEVDSIVGGITDNNAGWRFITIRRTHTYGTSYFYTKSGSGTTYLTVPKGLALNDNYAAGGTSGDLKIIGTAGTLVLDTPTISGDFGSNALIDLGGTCRLIFTQHTRIKNNETAGYCISLQGTSSVEFRGGGELISQQRSLGQGHIYASTSTSIHVWGALSCNGQPLLHESMITSVVAPFVYFHTENTIALDISEQIWSTGAFTSTKDLPFLIPVGTTINYVKVRTTTAFSGAGVLTALLDIGVPSELTRYITAYDTMAAVAVGAEGGDGKGNPAGTVIALKATLTTTGAFVNALTAGRVSIFISLCHRAPNI